MDALLDAVKAHLNARLELKAGECDVCPDGKPNPDSGQRFVSVWPGGITNQSIHALDERYSFNVTVTVRTSQIPRDRKRDGGCWKLAAAVRAALHMSYEVSALAKANDAAFDLTVPPVFENGQYLGAKGPDWFWSESEDGGDATGIAVQLAFGRCRRIQYIEEQE